MNRSAALPGMIYGALLGAALGYVSSQFWPVFGGFFAQVSAPFSPMQ